VIFFLRLDGPIPLFEKRGAKGRFSKGGSKGFVMMGFAWTCFGQEFTDLLETR
jgi:hypothetical protein